MPVTITLDALDIYQLSRTASGKTLITIPLEVLKRAYCDYVAAQVTAGRVTQPEGASIQ